MSITKFPGAKTSTGQAVRHAVRGIRAKTPVGRIVVILGAEVGGIVGDAAQKAFTSGAGTADRSRRERGARYASDALGEQQEDGRRAEEAYRKAYDEARQAAEQGAPRDAAGARGDGAGERRRPHGQEARTYRYGGKVVADYYEVLEVNPKARHSVIDKAYRALMREEHPDLGGNSRKAQLINEAFEVLRDPAKRREYDEQNGFC